MERTLSLRARQTLALSPRLQQSVRLLQLSALEFAQEIRQALITNPFLEEDETEDTQAPGIANVHDANTREEAPVEEAVPPPQDDAYESPGTLSDSYGERSNPNRNGDDSESDWTDWIESAPSLRDHLRNQLLIAQLEDRDRILAHAIIEALDDDGYLRQSLEELAQALTGFEPAVEADDLRSALRLVQCLEPCGVGARDLAECLDLQLQALPEGTPYRELARRVAREHLPLVARREVARLQRIESCDEEALRGALSLIRKLNPRPGTQYGDDGIRYIVPDVIVRKIRGKWNVMVNPNVLPRIRVNRVYADIFRRSPRETGSPLSQQLQEARWLIRNAEQRFATIQRVAEAIVERQKKFLDYGEVAMRPLALKQIADELGLHESTVSRVTNNKYMSTPRGLFEFKHFFSRQLSTSSGGVCSATAIRALIRELIEAEKPDEPLSDARLAEMLAEQGVRVARRTVTKYRRLMQLPNVELRRLS
ncbi:MAG TPA: RNA polymerase factor sigma-54 [Burkholderiales bacterium]|nr:RNA polymerase factor sigma-54 [Burkholderiales bacterium]